MAVEFSYRLLNTSNGVGKESIEAYSNLISNTIDEGPSNSLIRMRFRTYLFYLMAVTLSLPLLVLTYTQYRMIGQEIERENTLLAEDASALSNDVKGIVLAAKGLVTMAANAYALESQQNHYRLNKILIGLRDALPYFVNAHFDNAEGVTVAFDPPRNSKGESNIGVDHTQREHWKQLSGQDFPIVSDVIQAVGAASGPIVNIMSPAVNDKGVVVGYAVSALNLRSLYDEVVAGLGVKDSVVWILDRKGMPIYANDRSNHKDVIMSREEIQKYLQGPNVVSKVNRPGGSNLIGVIAPIEGLDWVVGIFKRAEDRETMVFSLIATNLLIFLFLLLLSFMMARLASKPLTDNVSRLMLQVRAGRAVPTPSEKVQTPIELVELQKAFCRLLAKVQSHQSEIKELKDHSSSSLSRELELTREDAQFLRQIIMSSPQSIIITDSNGFIRLASEKAVEQFGSINIGTSFKRLLRSKFVEEDSGSDRTASGLIKLKETGTGKEFLLFKSLSYIGSEKREIYVLSERI